MSEEKEAVFVEMVKESWKTHNSFNYASSVDDILVGAVVAGAVHEGNMLIDLTSDGTNHYLRFEVPDTHERLTFKLNHLTGQLERAKVLGHLADVTIGYGKRVDNLSALWDSFKQEMKSTFIMRPEPGVMTIDADITANYIYAQVGLIWSLEDYLNEKWSPDFEKIGYHIECTKTSLKKYLDGRLNLK